MLTHDDGKTGSESGRYEAVTKRNTAQHAHVEKSSLLQRYLSIARSFGRCMNYSHSSRRQQISSEVRSVECSDCVLSGLALLDRESGLQPL